MTSATSAGSMVVSWSGLALTAHAVQVRGRNCAIVKAPESELTAALSKLLSTLSTAASSGAGRSQSAPAARSMIGTSSAGIPDVGLSPAPSEEAPPSAAAAAARSNAIATASPVSSAASFRMALLPVRLVGIAAAWQTLLTGRLTVIAARRGSRRAWPRTSSSAVRRRCVEGVSEWGRTCCYALPGPWVRPGRPWRSLLDCPAGHERPGPDLLARDIGDDFRLHPVGRPKHLPPPQ